ncbi:hypothetical protein GA0070613_6393 [Micromonospora inositola]|uniref:Secreted protein/lipoprotein n=2 Tax=Micromonospora inositola TaxID=47865 RepID=A0A1C5K534_9ACTN|nr:hypothetical protein GA0070613_6393 [Micromonospora inositola]
MLLGSVGACRSTDTPKTNESAAPSVSAPAPDARDAAEQAALAAYRGMWQAYAKAGLTANPNEPNLPKFAGGNALQYLRNGLTAYRRKGQILKGEYISNPQVANVSLAATPRTVALTDCVDDTKFLVYTASGQPINDTTGGRRATRATATDLAEGWRVTSFGVQEVGTC